MNNFPSLTVIQHPLIQDKLTLLRSKDTCKREFRSLLKEISLLMGYEMTRHWPLKHKTIETPMCSMTAPYTPQSCTLVAVLRAGLGMLDGLLTLLPTAREGHIGLYRDHETKQAVQYMVKLPPADDAPYFLIDPMLATGNSIIKAIQILEESGVKSSQILFMSLIAAPEGVNALTSAYPEIPIFTTTVDERLNDHAYIVPGLGDAGDRMFGT